MRLGLSHLRKQLFNYHLIDSQFCEHVDSLDVPETPKHFLLHVECPKFIQPRRTKLRNITGLLVPGVNYNTVIGLLGDHLCKIL